MMIDFAQFPSPCYIMEEELLRKNLTLIKSVADRAGVEIILAFKSFAMWRSFPIFREYIRHSTASSVYEARLALEEFGSKAHTYSPAYTERDFPEIMRCSSHITFNSMAQFERFYSMTVAEGSGISCGIRVNPEYSEVETELYNPCAPGTRFGITADLLPETLPQGIEGFHCHCHCESSSYELGRTLEHLESKFSRWFPQIKWLNLGGGHLMTRKDYDTEHLIKLLKELRTRYPHLQIILEPGSAFTWQTGVLTSEVVDIVESRGIKTAILNVSFTCHMPDCICIYLDGELLNEINSSETQNQGWNGNTENPFSNDIDGFGHYILLNLAIGGNGGDPSNSLFPMRYEVDYVRVYQKK